MTDGLVEFLRARLDEDEQVARAALPGPWEAAYHYDAFGDVGPAWTVVALHTAPATAESTGEDPAHIGRWDPARVLAEVEAKRAVITLWQTADTMFRDAGGESGAIDDKIRFWSDRAKGLEDALRLLALPYAGHEQFQEEW